MEEKHLYDEQQELPSPWEWVIIIAFSASLMGFGWLVYLLVPDAPRRWDFGQLPDAPAESIYSTEQPDISGKPRQQVWTLPEAQIKKPGPAQRKSRRDGR